MVRFGRTIHVELPRFRGMAILALLAAIMQLAWPVALVVHASQPHDLTADHDESRCPTCQAIAGARTADLPPLAAAINSTPQTIELLTVPTFIPSQLNFALTCASPRAPPFT